MCNSNNILWLYAPCISFFVNACLSQYSLIFTPPGLVGYN